MSKKLFKRFMPTPQQVLDHKYLGVFGTLLHNPNLWYLNRRSVSWAVAAGLFIAFTPPVPFSHTLAIAALAVVLHFNLPIAAAVIWVNNPFTMGPIFYFIYKIGSFLLGTPPMRIVFRPNWEWLVNALHWIWKPFLLGSLALSIVSALLGYILVQGVWRIQVLRDWKKRKLLRQQRLAPLTKS